MVTTRLQEKKEQVGQSASDETTTKQRQSTSRGKRKVKSIVDEPTDKLKEKQIEEPPAKKQKTDDQNEADVDWVHDRLMLEMGHIYFFYRPHVSTETVESATDVARLYFLLRPFSDDKAHTHKNRLIMMGKKHLPSTVKHEKAWGFVDAVATDAKDIVARKFEAVSYHTETKGDREIEPVRPCGEGVYSFVEHHKGVILAYVLELPEHISEVQKAFNISHEGCFYISVKNPEVKAQPGLPHHDVTFPKDLQEEFQGRRWLPLKPITFLDTEQAELLFIGASPNVVQELGEEGAKIEEESEVETAKKNFNAELIYKELKMKKSQHPIDPIKLGKWA